MASPPGDISPRLFGGCYIWGIDRVLVFYNTPLICIGAGMIALLCQGVPAQESADESTGVESSWTGARQALASGRNQIAATRYEEAEKSFRWAITLAPADSELRGEAERALYLELPSHMVRNLLSNGQFEEARTVLGRAINIAADHPDYMQQLTAMEADLNKGNFLEAGIPVIETDGRSVIKAVTEVLQEHHGAVGRYPVSISEVNRLLPPGDPPLEQFFVSRYSTTGAGYQLQLTNLNNRQQVLSIDHTGLLQ